MKTVRGSQENPFHCKIALCHGCTFNPLGQFLKFYFIGKGLKEFLEIHGTGTRVGLGGKQENKRGTPLWTSSWSQDNGRHCSSKMFADVRKYLKKQRIYCGFCSQRFKSSLTGSVASVPAVRQELLM